MFADRKGLEPEKGSQEVKKFNHVTIWDQKAQNLGPKHGEFGSETRENMEPKDLWPEFALPLRSSLVLRYHRL
jgi:hypothetical protein